MSKPFLKTLAGEKQDRIPFWFMRQAGRYLPEYRELRAQKGGFLEMAFDPVAACEITIQPLRRFNMDAAILFSDILTIPIALGQSVDFVAGEGPKLGPLEEAFTQSEADFSKLTPVYETLERIKTQMQIEGFEETALIGFAGAPWTVATYMVEGGSSRDFLKTKLMSYQDPEKFQALIDRLVESTARYLIDQVNAGAEALQIFDSWAGALDAQGFKRWCIGPIREIIHRIRAVHPDVPIIGFPKGAGVSTLDFVKETGVSAVGLDSGTPTLWASKNLQTLCPVQGNLDPFVLLAGGDLLKSEAERIVEDLGGGPFIFNLGHGIHKDTPPAHVEQLVEIIRNGH